MHRYNYYESDNYFIVHFVQDTNKNEIMATIEEIYRSDWYTYTVNEIWDFTNCEVLSLEVVELLEIAQLSLQIHTADKKVKTALVGEKQQTLQVLNEFNLLAKELVHKVEVFEKIDDAKAWFDSGKGK